MRPVAVFTILLLAGCGSGVNAKVSGQVTFDGKLLDVGTVAFHPIDGGPIAYGKIQSDGRYTLMTANEEGVIAGEYLVTVVTGEPPRLEGRPNDPGKSRVPPEYGVRGKSGLRFMVQPGANVLPIRLESKKTPVDED